MPVLPDFVNHFDFVTEPEQVTSTSVEWKGVDICYGRGLFESTRRIECRSAQTLKNLYHGRLGVGWSAGAISGSCVRDDLSHSRLMTKRIAAFAEFFAAQESGLAQRCSLSRIHSRQLPMQPTEIPECRVG